MTNNHLTTRMRRIRHSDALRNLIQEVQLHPSDFVQPIFIKEGLEQKKKLALCLAFTN